MKEQTGPSHEKLTATQFRLAAISIEGGTVLSNAVLEDLYRDKLGKEISLLDIFALRDAITKKYRDAGYLLSQAIVPAQRIHDGAVRIQILEGYISDVKFEGDVNDRRDLIQSYADHIKNSRPLRYDVLQRYVLLINDLPGISAKAVLHAADQPGAAQLVLIVKKKDVFVSASADNRGSRTVGPYEFQGQIALNDIFGLMEQTTAQLAYAPSQKLFLGSISHTEYLGDDGLSVTAFYGKTLVKPGSTLVPLDIIANSNTYRIGLSYPFLRTQARSLWGEGGFRARDTHTNSLSTLLYEDRTRVLYLSGTYDFSDFWLNPQQVSKSTVKLTASQGLDAFGATKTGTQYLSRSRAQSDFTKLEVEASRDQPIFDTVSLYTYVNGQFSDAPLFASEQIGFGGSQIGRAYEPSEITGDDGIGVNLELRETPNVVIPYIDGLQVYGFWDFGQVWNRSVPSGTSASDQLMSAGIGVRMMAFGCLSINGELARPLTRDVMAYYNRNIRPFFTITTAF